MYLVCALQEDSGLFHLSEYGVGYDSFDEHLQAPPPLLYEVLSEASDHRLVGNGRDEEAGQ